MTNGELARELASYPADTRVLIETVEADDGSFLAPVTTYIQGGADGAVVVVTREVSA